MRYDPSGKQIAMSTINGDLKIMNTFGQLNKELVVPNESSKAISQIRWNPVSIYYKYVDQNLLTAVQSDGLIQSWFPSSKDPISRIETH